MTTNSFSENIKGPNVSGQFYESDPKQLSSIIDKYIKDADIIPLDKRIDIIIAPHAGYFFSGKVAAYGFKAASKNKYSTVVILAPSHRIPLNGMSVSLHDGFKTPLGVVKVDKDFAQDLINQGGNFTFEPKAFEGEHSAEVEIPFIQKTFKDAKIVPVIVGQPSPEIIRDFAVALINVIGSREDVLIVVSSDMSHFHDDNTARKMDKKALDFIKVLDAQNLWEKDKIGELEMCGINPVIVALFYAKLKGLDKIEILKYATSAEVSNDKTRVVGYPSVIMYSDKHDISKDFGIEKGALSLNLDQKKKLIAIAKDTINLYIKNKKKFEVKVDDLRLSEEEGAFVTIHEDGQLRGCIGNIIGQGPLYLTIRDMAIAAATQDPRFKPVTVDELNKIDIEISVLSKPKRVKSLDEIKMGVHGVIVKGGMFNQGVFLPQVAIETGWSKEEFLSELCSQKAHLPKDAWKDPKTILEIFTAEVFSEKDVK